MSLLPNVYCLLPTCGSIILFAFLLDIVLGDPRWFPHPVVLIGKLIASLEGLFRVFFKSKVMEFAAGALLAVIVPAVAFVAAYRLIEIAGNFGVWLGWLVSVFLGYTAIAAKSLYKEPLRVSKLLLAGDFQGARKELSNLVGRDTHNLDEKGIVRALVETIAENTSDGVIAPLFYLAIGGPPLAMVYKAVNTLDSMVGYKNERYLYFGKASARLDDIANYIPARITVILLVFAAFILRKDWKGAWRITLRDGRNHASPNSGYPEAAVAGALGIKLGGLSSYGGAACHKPFLGNEQRELEIKDVRNAGRLMFVASLLMMVAAILISASLEW